MSAYCVTPCFKKTAHNSKTLDQLGFACQVCRRPAGHFLTVIMLPRNT